MQFTGKIKRGNLCSTNIRSSIYNIANHIKQTTTYAAINVVVKLEKKVVLFFKKNCKTAERST